MLPGPVTVGRSIFLINDYITPNSASGFNNGGLTVLLLSGQISGRIQARGGGGEGVLAGLYRYCMCGPKGYGLSVVLVIRRVSFLTEATSSS